MVSCMDARAWALHSVFRDVDCYWTWCSLTEPGCLATSLKHPLVSVSKCVGVVCVIFKHGFWGSRLWCSGLGNKTLPAEPPLLLSACSFSHAPFMVYLLYECGRAHGAGLSTMSVSQLRPSGLVARALPTGPSRCERSHPSLSFIIFILRQVVVQPGIEPMMSSASTTPALEAP